MNQFLAIFTSIVLIAGINNGDKKTTAPNSDEAKVSTPVKYTLSSKTNRRPQTTNIIPLTIVEEKYVAKVPTATGDTIRYAPIFAERKIKY